MGPTNWRGREVRGPGFTAREHAVVVAIAMMGFKKVRCFVSNAGNRKPVVVGWPVNYYVWRLICNWTDCCHFLL